MLELLILLLKFIYAILESSDPLKQLLHFLVSDHHDSPRLVQTTRDGLPAGDRPSEHTLSSALLYCEVRSNLRESGEIVLGVNTYGLALSRLALGIIFVVSGVGKVFAIGPKTSSIEAFAIALVQFGIPLFIVAAWALECLNW
ncbi:hypothetical protein GCM10008985_33040 [Halococcus dombrowskii]|uniref:MAPEG family protein n=1 Tax=Halococcus dombrowskii TaxID=179637 RepID=A0AAV3SKC5_HALDO